MICTLVVARYPKWLGWAGLLSMAVFRLPLWLSPSIHFWKLMGCGRNGTFDKTPDWRQWAVLITGEEETQLPPFLHSWWRFWGCEKFTIKMQAVEGHGYWDGKACFGDLTKQRDTDGMIGVLTRATIRLNRLTAFWKEVDTVADRMRQAPGFIFSLGIGEIPWIKQATFSIWESKTQMQQFAYGMREHADVVRKTRKEKWYSEEMFVRFRILSVTGSLNGNHPLPGKS